MQEKTEGNNSKTAFVKEMCFKLLILLKMLLQSAHLLRLTYEIIWFLIRKILYFSPPRSLPLNVWSGSLGFNSGFATIFVSLLEIHNFLLPLLPTAFIKQM